MTADAWEARTIAEAPPPSALGPKRRLGRYVLYHELATGGMGTVYLARAPLGPDLSKVVAVKCIQAAMLDDDRVVRMFLDEARIATRIGHANVCTVFDFGREDDTYYLAMELLVGHPLSQLLARAQLRRDEEVEQRAGIAARLLADACEGLHAAHELADDAGKPLEVVHRDISPQNLFVTYDGILKVLDFGVASAAMRAGRDGPGLHGKVAYAAPEQLARRPLDRRADVWALGVVLWEMLALRRLFGADTLAETADRVRAMEIPPPSAVAPGIPPELDAIVARALVREPSLRYATARAMSHDLHRFFASRGMPIGPSEVTAWMHELVPGGRAAQARMVERTASSPLPRDADTRPSNAGHAQNVRARSVLGMSRATTAVALVAGTLGILLGVLHGLTAAEGPRVARDAPDAAMQPAPRTAVDRTETGGAEPPATEPRVADVTIAAEDAPPAATRPEPAKRPRRAARRVAKGIVAVSVPNGWADVYVEGRLVGRAPGRVELPAGRHVLDVRPFGQAPSHRRAITVRPGGTTRVSVSLDRAR